MEDVCGDAYFVMVLLQIKLDAAHHFQQIEFDGKIDAHRWYDEEGFFFIVDRKKDMIIVSGFNVFPNEIEEVVAMHDGILEVAADGVPHEVSGEQVRIFVVKKDPLLTEKDIIKHCRKNLTNYKVPKFVEFKDELPKTNVGKILRRALKEAS